MARKVIVIVSGETDRRSVPLLCRHFSKQVDLFEVRKPPGNAALTPEQAIKLIKAGWYEMKWCGEAPDKFVVLVDCDAFSPDVAAEPFEKALAQITEIPVARIVAVAVRHLEAWFFGDVEKLREFLGRDPGRIDTSRPDEIDNPKLHLENLLQSRSRVYTARVAEQIAGLLDPPTIEGRSPSFAGFVNKLRNGVPS